MPEIKFKRQITYICCFLTGLSWLVTCLLFKNYLVGNSRNSFYIWFIMIFVLITFTTIWCLINGFYGPIIFMIFSFVFTLIIFVPPSSEYKNIMWKSGKNGTYTYLVPDDMEYNFNTLLFHSKYDPGHFRFVNDDVHEQYGYIDPNNQKTVTGLSVSELEVEFVNLSKFYPTIVTSDKSYSLTKSFYNGWRLLIFVLTIITYVIELTIVVLKTWKKRMLLKSVNGRTEYPTNSLVVSSKDIVISGKLMRMDSIVLGDVKIQEECCICMDNKCNVAFKPCLHALYCLKCIGKIQAPTCPTCRTKIIGVYHYHSESLSSPV
jgi:hypothetical protein